MEWGCMQALIDYVGWKAWKGISTQKTDDATKKVTTSSKGKNKKNRTLTVGPPAVST